MTRIPLGGDLALLLAPDAISLTHECGGRDDGESMAQPLSRDVCQQVVDALGALGLVAEGYAKVWTCPGCGFAFDAAHVDSATDAQECPCCQEALEAKVAEVALVWLSGEEPTTARALRRVTQALADSRATRRRNPRRPPADRSDLFAEYELARGGYEMIHDMAEREEVDEARRAVVTAKHALLAALRGEE